MSTTVTLSWLLMAVISCAACYVIAKRKHRNAVGYAVLGFLLPVIGVIAVAVVEDKNFHGEHFTS
jgi:hypothetical protein